MAFLTCASGQAFQASNIYINCLGGGYEAKQAPSANDYVMTCSHPPSINSYGLVFCSNAQIKKFSELTVDDGYLVQVADDQANEWAGTSWPPNDFYHAKISGISYLELSQGVPTIAASRTSSAFDLSPVQVDFFQTLGLGLAIVGSLALLIALRKSINLVNRC